MTIVPEPELLVLLRLLVSHLLADFLFQPRNWIEKKARYGLRAPELYYHVAVVGILTYLLLADWSHIGLPLFIMATHFCTDWWKSARPRKARYFVIDQIMHLVLLLAAWGVYAGIIGDTMTILKNLLAAPPFWIILAGYLSVVWPFGYLIAMVTERWQEQLTGDDSDQLTGLQNAGMWIGRIERFLILTFILMNQYSAIGFLIAAKSVFRFSGRLEDGRERKEAEYILIGTLLSFALSIGAGILVIYFLG